MSVPKDGPDFQVQGEQTPRPQGWSHVEEEKEGKREKVGLVKVRRY